VAAVFVRRGDPAADARIPTLDPGARHFRDPQAPSIPTEVGAAHRELLALGSLGANTADRPDATWTVRVPALLSALDRAALALDEATDPAGVWAAAGACYRSLILDPRRPPASPSDRWDPVAGVRWAQATYCLRRAQRADPADPRALYELHESFRARRMADAQRTVGREWLAADALPPDLAESIRRHADRVGPPIRPRGTTEPGRVLELLRSGRPEDATGFAEALGRLPWEPAEAVAGAWLHLGEPGKARGVWQAATGAPSEAVRSARVGSTYWVERDYAAAERAFADAQRADPDLAEPCWALAWLYAETGRADRAAAEARNALARRPSPRAREELEPLLAFLARYVERTGQ
jgi:tetratricopeptide (TPR) repeat protein